MGEVALETLRTHKKEVDRFKQTLWITGNFNLLAKFWLMKLFCEPESIRALAEHLNFPLQTLKLAVGIIADGKSLDSEQLN